MTTTVFLEFLSSAICIFFTNLGFFLQASVLLKAISVQVKNAAPPWEQDLASPSNDTADGDI